MREVGGRPIWRKITSMKKLSSNEQRRLKRLKEIFRKEGRIPPGTSRFEVKYLYRLEAGRRRHQWKKRPTISEQEELEEAKKIADPSRDRTIEEILASMARKKDEQGEGSEE